MPQLQLNLQFALYLSEDNVNLIAISIGVGINEIVC